MGVVGSLFLASAAAICGLTPAARLTLPDRHVRVADIATLDCLAPALRELLGALTIASLPREGATVRLSRTSLATLARRRAPILSVLQPTPGDIVLHAAAAPAPSATASCFSTTAMLAPHAALTKANIAPAPCDGPSDAALRFDRLHAIVRAAQAAPSGTYVGRLTVADAVLDAGTPLTFVTEVGSARIERTLTAAQPDSGGKQVFVRDLRGRTFPAPLTDRQAVRP